MSDELKKVRAWLFDYYAMFDEGHTAMTLLLERVGEREVESFEAAHRAVTNVIDAHIRWADGIRPAPLPRVIVPSCIHVEDPEDVDYCLLCNAEIR